MYVGRSRKPVGARLCTREQNEDDEQKKIKQCQHKILWYEQFSIDIVRNDRIDVRLDEISTHRCES